MRGPVPPRDQPRRHSQQTLSNQSCPPFGGQGTCALQSLLYPRRRLHTGVDSREMPRQSRSSRAIREKNGEPSRGLQLGLDSSRGLLSSVADATEHRSDPMSVGSWASGLLYAEGLATSTGNENGLVSRSSPPVSRPSTSSRSPSFAVRKSTGVQSSPSRSLTPSAKRTSSSTSRIAWPPRLTPAGGVVLTSPGDARAGPGSTRSAPPTPPRGSTSPPCARRRARGSPAPARCAR